MGWIAFCIMSAVAFAINLSWEHFSRKMNDEWYELTNKMLDDFGKYIKNIEESEK